MIKLTAVQAQVLTALGVLIKSEPTSKMCYSLLEIYKARLRALNKNDPNGVLKRTTQNTLFKLKERVPQLVTDGPVSMWGLTVAGKAVVETQLGVS